MDVVGPCRVVWSVSLQPVQLVRPPGLADLQDVGGKGCRRGLRQIPFKRAARLRAAAPAVLATDLCLRQRAAVLGRAPVHQCHHTQHHAYRRQRPIPSPATTRWQRACPRPQLASPVAAPVGPLMLAASARAPCLHPSKFPLEARAPRCPSRRLLALLASPSAAHSFQCFLECLRDLTRDAERRNGERGAVSASSVRGSQSRR